MTQTIDRPRLSRLSLLLIGLACMVLVVVIGMNLFRRYRQAALFRAAAQGDIVQVQALLRGGVDPNLVRQYYSEAQGKVQESPLLLAARGSHWQAARLLLEAGADANFYNAIESPLNYAVEQQQTDLVRDLLERHADVTLSSSMSGNRPLCAAVASGNREIVQALLEAGADATEQDWHGTRVLSTAVEHNHIDVVLLLLAHGADVNARNSSHAMTGAQSYREGGFTPLLLAVRNGNKPMVELLLAHGASPRVKWTPYKPAKNPMLTPLQAALRQKRQDIAALLRKAGATE